MAMHTLGEGQEHQSTNIDSRVEGQVLLLYYLWY